MLDASLAMMVSVAGPWLAAGVRPHKTGNLGYSKSPTADTSPAPIRAPRRTEAMAGALDGIRVLDFSHVPAGPVCTQQLRLQGADVVKVESGAGDAMRHYGGERHPEGLSASFVSFNAGKRSIVLDLKDPDRFEVTRRLDLGLRPARPVEGAPRARPDHPEHVGADDAVGRGGQRPHARRLSAGRHLDRAARRPNA